MTTGYIEMQVLLEQARAPGWVLFKLFSDLIKETESNPFWIEEA